MSSGAYADLNLSTTVGDHPAAVQQNRALLSQWVGAPLVFATQVHGTDIAVVTEVPTGQPRADGLVTTRRGLGLVIDSADCVPVLLADADASVIGAVHAGRVGLVAGVVPAAVAAMRAAGARVLNAAIGPAICGACYEVPARMADEVESLVPGTRCQTRWGTAGLDLVAGVVCQLTAAGVAVVAGPPACTFEDEDFYSYRRANATGHGPTGRQGAFIRC